MFYWIAMAFCTLIAVIFVALPHVWLWIPWGILMISVNLVVASLFRYGADFAERPRSYLTALVAPLIGKILMFWAFVDGLGLLHGNSITRATINSVGVQGPGWTPFQVNFMKGFLTGWHDLIWWPLKPWGVTHTVRISHIGHPGAWAILWLKYDGSMVVLGLGLAIFWWVASNMESWFWFGLSWLLRGGRPPKMQATTNKTSAPLGVMPPGDQVDQGGGMS